MQPLAVLSACAFDATGRGDLSLEDMIYRTGRAALDSAGLQRGEIDHVSIASSDGIDGRAISAMVTSGSVGAYGRSLMNTSSAGEHALVLGALQVMAGRSRYCLVVTWAKPSESPLDKVDALASDPFFLRPFRLTRGDYLALQCRAIAADAGLDVDWAPEMQWPNCAIQFSKAPDDAAVALVLCPESLAAGRGTPYTLLSGFGWGCDSYWRGTSELATLPSLRNAARAAYRMGGISDPAQAFDYIDLAAYGSLHVVAFCHALGLHSDDTPSDFAAKLLTGDTGLHIHTGFGNRDFATGLAAIAVAHERLLAGSALRRSLIHASSYNAAQSNAVFILEKRIAP
jgi:acetyl-CoA C-acetyltransferase